MTYIRNSAQESTLLVALTREINHRMLLGLLAILVVFLHIIAIFWLLQQSHAVKENKSRKLVQVLLMAQPEPKIKPEPPKPKIEPKLKPKPLTPEQPKKIPPKLTAGKSHVKAKTPDIVKPVVAQKSTPVRKPQVQKTPVIAHKISEPVTPKSPSHKVADLPRTPAVLTSKSVAHSTTVFNRSSLKPYTQVSKPSPAFSSAKTAPSKPVQQAGSSGQDNNTVSSGVVELAQAKPTYPMRAKSRNIEGWAKVEFTVTASGEVTNAHIVSASPPGIFDASALEAIQKFRFKAKMVNGKAVNGSATKKFNFNLN
ncbi:energy transducer TonB [Crenothrix polyspora]|uniref:Protein TonB n=1 Tax=Crenothrix polyspora TaxID=360316 RepID=A0A1R4HC26_9GAMM|nr:energy transducer TonB [Crenothrix polyspora]SJM93808.1 putative TonB family protein [Crenothrix polyspora]